MILLVTVLTLLLCNNVLCECTCLLILVFLSHFMQNNCLLILRCFCNCAQCDYGIFGGGLLVIVNCIYIIFLVTVLTLLSCYVI